ncbi:MAG: thioredoxin [Firmicutes bacterium]|nr:thioredoxin [Bacillota bacterium]
MGNPKLRLPIRPYRIILALGICFISIGAFRSEFETILLNALILCTSCIGLR